MISTFKKVTQIIDIDIFAESEPSSTVPEKGGDESKNNEAEPKTNNKLLIVSGAHLGTAWLYPIYKFPVMNWGFYV